MLKENWNPNEHVHFHLINYEQGGSKSY